MRRGALLVLAGLFVGVLYGKIATIYHLHLPPNWLARLTGADGETAEELAYYTCFSMRQPLVSLSRPYQAFAGL